MATSISRTWGTEPRERELPFPCDRYDLGPGTEVYHRGVSVQASPAILFRWLCQMRVAPYSYDWIDNFGRRSPQTLTEGLDALQTGQSVMTIFELVDFEKDRHLTIRMRPPATRMFGEGVGTYLIVPQGPQQCRLLVKLLFRQPQGLHGWLTGKLLPWGDLVMMRRQLLNFKRLAEQSARLNRGPGTDSRAHGRT